MVQVAVLGYGTVGSGVVEVIETNHDSILAKAGVDLQVKYVLDLREFPGDPIEKKLVHDYDVIVNDPEVDIVVEVMGGTNPAYTFTKRALEAGKSVCTSNKELVARHGTELQQIAGEHHASYLFEASCGGGIPIIRPLRTSLTADVIDEITGILNGTTNYILSKMIDEGLEFEEVLRDAQQKGYAERNPEADVEGHDACRKIAILSSLAYGKCVDFTDIYTEGITRITSADIQYAKAMKKTIKLLAYSSRQENQVMAMVAPYLVDKNDPLYAVNGVFNAIFVHGNMLGDAMFYGQGAGKEATASAVVGDVIEEAQMLGKGVVASWSPEKQVLTDVSGTSKRFFVRVKGSAADSSAAEKAFGKIEVVDAGLAQEYGFVTECMTEAEYEDRASKMENVLGMLRIR
ncbi:MAG: homoserine dehydrogenase [Lachnospiraceae bacterium]|jgi:homoserine dehydrogenase|nr:homoserine dehydrogenase [Lachnospiraceae bacterium]RKJ48481.1 homoserine dehydrogenase [bacterium 1XD42-54]